MNFCFVIFPKVRDKNEPINQSIKHTNKKQVIQLEKTKFKFFQCSILSFYCQYYFWNFNITIFTVLGDPEINKEKLIFHLLLMHKKSHPKT